MGCYQLLRSSVSGLTVFTFADRGALSILHLLVAVQAVSE